MPQAPARGYAILIQAGPDEFWMAGASVGMTAESSVPGAPLASLGAVQEGNFEKGRWVVRRHLAGDDTGQGGADRASLRLPANPGILHVVMYSYR